MFTFSNSQLGLNAGSFSADRGKITVRLSDAKLHFDSKKFNSSGMSQFKADSSGIEVGLNFQDGMVSLQVKNRSNRSLKVEEIELEFAPSSFLTPMKARDYRQLIHSRDFMTLSAVKPVHLPTEWLPVDAESAMVSVFSHVENNQVLLIGAVPPFSSGYTSILAVHDTLHREGNFGIKLRFVFKQTLDIGQILQTPFVVAMIGDRGETLLESYGRILRDRLAKPIKPTITGWNSWDYYAGAITRSDMDENMAAIEKNFGHKVKYIVIDEGWECMWGVWQPNWKFPEGLEDFCRHVRAKGFIPGIWTAPLMVNYYTSLYRSHPDWFVGKADGNIHLVHLSYGMMAQLDITHPEVQDHLRKIYTNLRECGFEYFKVDFAQMILGAEQFHDSHIGQAEIVREIYKLIRECIGEKNYLLSCGAPYESVIGVVDAYRTTGDIHNYWGMIVQNIVGMFSRWWMQGCVGNTDPDFLIVRSKETTDDRQLNRRLSVAPKNHGMHWMDGAEMNIEEAKVLALATYLMGGDLFLSDAIGKLNSQGIDLINKVVPPLPRPAQPLNLFDSESNRYFIWLGETEQEFILACFNLTDYKWTKILKLDFLNSSTQAFDFWTSAPFTLNKAVELTLPPRSAQAFRIPKKR